MGERASVVLHYGTDETPVYLYSHWGAPTLARDVARALDRGRDRWYDPGYLARIIFCQMVGPDQQGTTGYGITPYPLDSEMLHVYLNARTVQLENWGGGSPLDYDQFIANWLT